MSIQGQCHLLTLAKGHLHIIFKTQFSQKPLHQSKPNFTCAILSKGNQSLYKWSWSRSHDQDGRHAHIYVCGKIL